MKKSADTRFRKRVFLLEEEAFILADREPDAMLWAFWTGKEAAYKAVQKEWIDVPAIPHLYRVGITGEGDERRPRRRGQEQRRLLGNVATPQGNIALEILLTADYAHSVALSGPAGGGEQVLWRIKPLPLVAKSSPDQESRYIRGAAKRHLSRYWHSSVKDVDIRRRQGPRGLEPPRLYFRQQASAVDISLSHDGNFAAYALAFPNPDNLKVTGKRDK